MSRSPLQWWALAALLLVPATTAFPALAQDAPEPPLVYPFPAMGSYISWPPRQFCSEAARRAYLESAEKARALIESDADHARAYFIALRQRLGASQAAGNREGVRHYMDALRAFEHGEDPATQNDGPLHSMTITHPAGIEAKIAAARAAPLIDCSTLEAVAARRPQLDEIDFPALPARLCSEEEREALRRRLRQAVEAAKAQIAQTTAYLESLEGNSGLGWRPPPTAEEALYADNLRVEWSWARGRNLANSRLQYQAEQREKALAAMPIVACDDPPGVNAVPATPLGPVPARPPLPPGPAPIPTTPLCTALDLRARIEQIDAAIRAANARLVMANTHLIALGILSDTATRGKADFFVIDQINEEVRSYQATVDALDSASDALRALRTETIARPLDPCPTPTPPADGVMPGTPVQPDKPAPSPSGEKKACLPDKQRPGRAPISVGSNGRVGSGARAKKKLASTLGGLAGGLLGGGGGGSGGGKSGPPVAKCRIKDSEKTVFTDPGTGISLRVGAKRSGDVVMVFADVARSPDSGTFQGGWIEKPDGGLLAPARADICELWGEWSLTVSWTRETWVDGNLVSRETGGYGDSGRFSLPRMISSDARPAGLWQQLGFSNASHGAREVALGYRLPRVDPEGMPLLLHVTRPSRNPVDTQPFAVMMKEGPGGFTFAAAPDAPCEE